MGQGTETCTDRPTEVSVIRFVSRNHTIEEIAPKKEVYTCKQRGCGKIFTNQDEYKTHEALEALKIRFICREPGCGEELSDPGSMWRHYQEWHNSETNVFACPYTNCGSVHTTSCNLEEHIESCHRQPPTLPTEPEIICFEGPDNAIEEDTTQNSEDGNYDKKRNDNFALSVTDYNNKGDGFNRHNGTISQTKDFCHDQNNVTASAKNEEYSTNNDCLNRANKFPKNKDLLITKENFLIKYDTASSKTGEIIPIENSQEKNNVVYINGDVTITKNIKGEANNLNLQNQEHRIDLGNLERVFRSGLEQENSKIEDNTIETNSNCSDDEEYMPKKQRMSRYKQEIYKCDINGCGKKYKYISHYRHHQDSHKLVTNSISTNTNKCMSKIKQQGRASTISFFLCKMPGCGVQVNNVTGLWQHYQDNHANTKPPVVQAAKNNEVFRCKIPGCEIEFSTTLMLYKHFNEVHSNSSINNASLNTKTGNGNSFHFAEVFQDDAKTQQGNFKTDFKAKTNVTSNDYIESGNDRTLSPIVKEESRD
ncbi:hypothetical protein HZH68_008608 [Vespula germanica]|uniref:C2H2-type domain-containing protein n=1 Tax=Vespula germanica TaxID=30212 RepID=A0A834JZN0_VESGE|nr:hypothetical protein HZH68_008608 [Vespula germanica]